MGKYATTSSISLIAPGFLAGNTTTSDTEGASLFSKHIDRSEAKIDALLASRYATPFTTTSVPEVVRKWAEDLATFNAMRASYIQDGQLKQEYIDAYNDAQKEIAMAAEGTFALILTDGSLAPSRATTRFLSTTKNYTPIFGKDDPTLWKRDDDEKTDLTNDRK